MNPDVLSDGWYLMSARDVEIELRRFRTGEAERSNALRLSIAEALRYRDAGNIPDRMDRSLRLVLHVRSADELLALDQARARFEPDHHEAPRWRRPGSKPVNVVPLRSDDVPSAGVESWLDDDDVARLEAEWLRGGRIEGLRVPADYRSFVYKTVLALKRADRAVTIDSIVGSLARWLPETDAETIRTALEEENG